MRSPIAPSETTNCHAPSRDDAAVRSSIRDLLSALDATIHESQRFCAVGRDTKYYKKCPNFDPIPSPAYTQRAILMAPLAPATVCSVPPLSSQDDGKCSVL